MINEKMSEFQFVSGGLVVCALNRVKMVKYHYLLKYVVFYHCLRNI